MESLNRVGKQARRRMTITTFIGYLTWSLTIGIIVALFGLVIPKFVSIDVDPVIWQSTWWIGSVSIAVLAAIIATLMNRPTLFDAAREIDRRFQLRERLASSLAMSEEDRQTDLGRALVEDATKAAEKIDVRDEFSLGLRPAMLLPVVPMLLAALLSLLPDRIGTIVAVAQGPTQVEVKNATQPLIEQLAKLKKEAEAKGLNDAADLYKQLEAELKKMQEQAKLDTKEALSKLNEINDKLKEEKEKLGSPEAMKKSLAALEKMDAGFAQDIKDAVASNDFGKVAEKAQELAEKLANESLSKEELEKLAKQLEALEKALDETIKNHESAKSQVKEQMDKAAQSGDSQRAAELQKQLSELEAQDAGMQALQKMQQSLSEAQKGCKSGNCDKASDAMQSLAEQMKQMQQANDSLQSLDEMMQSASSCKSQMSCSKCSGEGCQACSGNGSGKSDGQGKSDWATGEGRGAGMRDEEEDSTQFYDSQVRGNMERGEVVNSGSVGGENRKGKTTAEVQQAILTSLAEEPESIDDMPLPKAEREHVKEYFNQHRQD